MRKLLTIITCVLPLIMMAQTGQLNPATTSTKWLKNRTIALAYSGADSASFAPERKAGKKWVFEYRHTDAEYVEMSDDEKTEIIAFEIAPVKGNCFTLRNAQLIKANTYFMLGCFCKDRGFKHVEAGSISGKKVNATTWKISFNLTIETGGGTITRKFSSNYRLQKN